MELNTVAARCTTRARPAPAGPWMGIGMASLLCILFASAALAAGEAFNDPSYFEGGNLSSNSSTVPKHNVTARKGAEPSTSSSEKSTLEAVGSKHPQQGELSPDGVAERNFHDHPQQTFTLRSNDTLKQNVSSTEAPAHNSTVAVSPTKSAPASDKPVDSSVKSTEAPLTTKKSNPHITVDIEDLPTDENGHVIVSKENLVGADPSFDFVVPIVIALLAVPFVAVLGAYVFKKSRDFWDRRHYRRMDFLIDGMYND